jgi:mono/diheme cytochrome c family protein
VYTEAQAKRGRNVYLASCRSCHAAESHTGQTFQTWWGDKTLADLYGFMSEKMPKNDPGSLDPQEYIDVIAYLLKMNTLPAGKTELEADPDSLAKIRILLKRIPIKKPTSNRN